MITIAQTSLTVHPLCLGGNVFGWSATEAASFDILNAYSMHGGNFLDTADVYSEWKEGNEGGESEKIIGNWMKKHNNRDSMIVATKVAKYSKRPGLSAKNIVEACNDSLRRLQTDHIDLYYAHEDDATTPLGESLEAFTQLIQEGKVRYIAASQYSAKRLDEALRVSKENGFASYVALQDQYNLMERKGIEGEMAEVISAHGISVIPFFGLARGFLSGKYKPGITVESVRAAGVVAYQNEKGWRTVEALEEIARHYACAPSAIALAWLRAQPTVSVPIASARTVEQLGEIVQAVEVSPEHIAQLSEITA
jgi:aryl-alcohol dehydrogenase-like predicted oxidoreductase